MSTFAFGICLMDGTDQVMDFALELKRYALSQPHEFYIELGGNAYAYWLYKKKRCEGLAFMVTDSVVDNTAEGVFQLSMKDMDSPDIEKSVFDRLYKVQELIKYMFNNNEVREILFYIVDDYVPECLENVELCHSADIASKLSDYCLQRLGANLALKILR